MKGETMRIATLVAALSVIASTPTMAQAPTDKLPAPPPTQQGQEPAPDQSVTAINIVRFEDLPPRLKTVVETKLQDTSADDLRELQKSVQELPVAMTMLAQNGLNVTQVVAAAVDPTGALTLVIQDTA
ncbi:hypothetical protein [Mesorhizobium sp. SP-1A]|uniref:hypothetical protein n=1 Tax=Mesorhizobium sp. SP-1A TaxID=3077840 RepID=UPI0028F6F917|nr:hypothetical protein [Mesorhizobium sp. SP-1A]